ncbi:MAG: prolipoprotein diacylglyceryl transferase [Elusimicrobia bacterium]|nr:prolipoprotein diacylglyceryl transferase [Elusimicrobiota bacterium]
MHPVFLQVGDFRVFSYGVLIALGGLFSCLIWYAKRAQMGLRGEDDFWLLVNAILIGGFLGGRVLHIIEYVPFRAAELWDAVFSLTRGFSVLGAFAGVIGGVWLTARSRRIAFLRLLDYVSLLAPFWHVFGRLGCLLAGCCHGRPADLPWAVRFTDPRGMVDPSLLGVPLHPTQLYEAAGDAAIFLALWRFVLPRLESGRLGPGTLSGLYFAAYGLLRFVLEFYRGDTVPGLLGLTGGQGLALALLAAGLGLAAWRHRKPCTPS